jgi:protein-S-isoprenylcysteine O-methyltransferase Ste14
MDSPAPPESRNRESGNGKITPFLAVQFCAVLIAILIVVFRPGAWTVARWAGLGIAVPAAALLFTARWQLGQSFSVTPRARELATHSVYSKIRNPIYVFSALLLVGVLIALGYRSAFLPLAISIPVRDFPRPPGSEGSGSQIRRGVSKI